MNNSTGSSVIIRRVNWQQAQEPLSLIRRLVFIQEQQVPEALEWDGLDNDAIHLLALDADQTPIGTARMLGDGHIGRMAVLRSRRHQGVATALLCELIAIARQMGLPQLELDAQTHAISFYQAHGFTLCSDVFIDAGIPHKKMRCILV